MKKWIDLVIGASTFVAIFFIWKDPVTLNELRVIASLWGVGFGGSLLVDALVGFAGKSDEPED